MPYRSQGISFYRKRSYEEALTTFLSCNNQPEKDEELSYLLGLCYTRLEQFDKALFYLEHSSKELEADPLHSYQIKMLLAYIYNRVKDYGQAERVLADILDAGFQSAQAYSVLGYTLWKKGDVERSFQALGKGVDIDSDNATLMNTMGYIMIEEERNLRVALRHCQKAVSLSPHNPNYLDSLGWAYYKSGRKKEALFYLSRAASISKNPAIEHHLKVVEGTDSEP